MTQSNVSNDVFQRDMGCLRSLWTRLTKNDSPGLAAEMTYNWVMALLPTLIFIFALFGMFGTQSNLFEEIMSRLQQLIPRDAFDFIQLSLSELTKDSNGSLAILSFLGALWTGSNGAITVEKALNRAYACELQKRSFWEERLVALLIVLGLGVLLFVCANLIVFGEVIFAALENIFHLMPWQLTVFGIIRWIIPISGLVVISAFIYWIAPNFPASSNSGNAKKQIWPGAFTFVSLWIMISWLFSLYVSNMGNYNKIYGPMGAMIILMIWLYLTSYALIIGGEVNALGSKCGNQ